ncbi:MAG: gliding motility-associated C-terminal domain-containing protein, partial [Bacteroidales bacterium]
TDNITIHVDSIPTITFTSTGPFCVTDSPEELNASPGGGTWTGDGIVDNTAGTFDPNVAGTGLHTITYTYDAGVCVNSSQMEIEVISLPDASIISSGPYCITDGADTLEASNAGGTWSGPGIIDADAGIFDPEIANVGIHTIEYSLSNGTCISTNSTDIEVLDMPQINLVSSQDPLCFGSANGMIEVTSPFVDLTDYNWNTGDTGTTVNGLSAGEYQVSVTDINGCTSEESYNLENPAEIILTDTVLQSPGCGDANDGYIEVEASGGTGNLSYYWDNGNSGYLIDSLDAGNYTLSVTDEHSCQSEFTFTLPDAPELYMETTVSPLLCYGDKNGSIQVNGVAGTPPYSYQISGEGFSINDSLAEHLEAGSYDIVITDAAGCTLDSTLTFTEPSPFEISLSKTHPSCRGNNDGEIMLSITGGTEPYACYLDDNVSDRCVFNELFQGNYTIEVIDNNGCSYLEDNIILQDNPEDCIRIPNAITPNDDGVNDTWIIENLDLFPSAKVEVYNRWGQKVYQGSPFDEPWNGTSLNGAALPTGSYIYTIVLEGDTGKTYNGIVTIVK